MRFYVLHINGKRLERAINAIRFICNPNVRFPAHVTVRGPYATGINTRKMNQKIHDSKIAIRSPGSFFEDNQNTIFLHCDSPELRQVWKKFDFDDYTPHITLYDGTSRPFAKRLLKILKKHKLALSFRAVKLEPLGSPKGNGEQRLDLRMDFPRDLLTEITGQQISAHQIDAMSERRRLQLVEAIAQNMAAPDIAAD